MLRLETLIGIKSKIHGTAWRQLSPKDVAKATDRMISEILNPGFVSESARVSLFQSSVRTSRWVIRIANVSYMIYGHKGVESPPVVLTIRTLQSVINGFKGGFENCSLGSFTWKCPPNCPSGTYRRTCRHLPFHPGCTLKHSRNPNKHKCQRSRHDQSQRPAQHMRISI